MLYKPQTHEVSDRVRNVASGREYEVCSIKSISEVSLESERRSIKWPYLIMLEVDWESKEYHVKNGGGLWIKKCH